MEPGRRGPVDVIDLGFGVLTGPRGTGRKLLGDLVSRQAHAEFVRTLDGDPEPIRLTAHPMAELAADHHLSTLGAESVAASERPDRPICVWNGDDGPRIRAVMAATDHNCRIIAR